MSRTEIRAPKRSSTFGSTNDGPHTTQKRQRKPSKRQGPVRLAKFPDARRAAWDALAAKAGPAPPERSSIIPCHSSHLPRGQAGSSSANSIAIWHPLVRPHCDTNAHCQRFFPGEHFSPTLVSPRRRISNDQAHALCLALLTSPVPGYGCRCAQTSCGTAVAELNKTGRRATSSATKTSARHTTHRRPFKASGMVCRWLAT